PNHANSGVVWSLDTGGSTIPTGISCAVSTASPQVLSCGAGTATTGPFTLPAGATITLHVTSSTPNSGPTATSCGAYANTASFTTTNDGSDSKSATETVKCPALTFSKNADAATVSAGSDIGCVVTLDNSPGTADPR